jgi:hypothetical protein
LIHKLLTVAVIFVALCQLSWVGVANEPTNVPIPAPAPTQRPAQTHEVYFEGSDYELHVYSTYGRRDGKTIFILGGIQGDEPGGYLSAEMYTNLRLDQGNLIVIPRANFKSIILHNRGISGDMNRLFVEDLKDSRMDYQVVQLVMQYMAKADLFLNLHDGWGFHDSEYVSEQRNPNRFGQSLIVDEDTFTCDDGTVLDLKGMATDVLAGANARIDNKSHLLSYLNTHTGNPAPEFRGMRRSATWFALRNYCLPAFGVEASKNISSVELKVLYHNYIINEFMRRMEVLPENPPIYIAPAVLDHALVTVNNESVYVSDGDVIELQPNDIIAVKHIESNHASGMTCDILGIGNLNDLQKSLPIGHSTKIIFRKDNTKFAEVTLQIAKQVAVVQPEPQPATQPQAAQPATQSAAQSAANAQAGSTTQPAPLTKDSSGYSFELLANGKTMTLSANEKLSVSSGTVVMITKIMLDGNTIDLPVNVRGWMPHDEASNNGDDRGMSIPIRRETMLKNFSTGKRGKEYPITVDSGGKEVTRAYIVIK